MALFKDASGQLVIANSLPVGGSAVSAAASANLVDLAPWYRGLDAGNNDWHPAKYYSGAAETSALGTNGYSNAQVAAYKRSATLPTDNPGTVTYDFTNASITTSLGNGWYSDIPAGSGPVYAIYAPTASQDTTVAIAASDWINIVLLFDTGSDGESSFISYVFIRALTQPTTPDGGSYASPLPTTVGWSDGIPSDNNQPLWMAKRTFSKSGAAPQDAAWSSASKVGTPSKSSKLQFSIDGSTGWHDIPAAGDEFMRTGTSSDNGAIWTYAGSIRVKGEAGSSGTATRGPSHWYTAGSFWSDSVANTLISAAGYAPMAGDQVTIASANFAYTRKYSGSAWIDIGVVIDGSMVLTDTLNVSHINTNGLDIRDFYGNVLFAVNTPLDYGRVGGTKPPSNADNTLANTGGIGINLIPHIYSGFDTTVIPPVETGGAGFVVLDTVSFYSGNASLRLFCSSVEIYTYLWTSGKSNIKLTPYKKYIVSAVVAASSLASIEIMIRTSNGNHYGVALTAIAGWHRVSGIIDLSSESDVNGVLRIDNNTPGAHVYFDNIMLEVQLGGQTTPSPYAPGYAAGAMSAIDYLHSGNIAEYLAALTLDDSYIANLSASKLSVGFLQAARIDATEIYMGTLNLAQDNINVQRSDYEMGFALAANETKYAPNSGFGYTPFGLFMPSALARGSLTCFIQYSFPVTSADRTLTVECGINASNSPDPNTWTWFSTNVQATGNYHKTGKYFPGSAGLVADSAYYNEVTLFYMSSFNLNQIVGNGAFYIVARISANAAAFGGNYSEVRLIAIEKRR